jgi:hypothetical protein
VARVGELRNAYKILVGKPERDHAEYIVADRKIMRRPFEKFVDWRQCATFMLLFLPLYNNGSMPPDHELFKWPS